MSATKEKNIGFNLFPWVEDVWNEFSSRTLQAIEKEDRLVRDRTFDMDVYDSIRFTLEQLGKVSSSISEEQFFRAECECIDLSYTVFSIFNKLKLGRFETYQEAIESLESSIKIYETPERLSRDKEILKMRASGMTYKEIGEKVGLSHMSVYRIIRHGKNIRGKKEEKD